MHIPKADTLNHINASAAHYYVLIANGQQRYYNVLLIVSLQTKWGPFCSDK